MAADCEMLSREVATALEKIRDESAGLYHLAQDAAAEALQRDLPRRLAPQLEELTRDLTAQLSQEALAQGNAYAEQTGAALQTLGSACAQAEELLKRLREHAAAVEARIASFAASAEREAEETARAHGSHASSCRTHRSNAGARQRGLGPARGFPGARGNHTGARARWFSVAVGRHLEPAPQRAASPFRIAL